MPTNAPQLSKWTIDPSFEEIMLSVFQNQYPDIDFQPEVLDHLIEEIRLFIGKWHLTENEFNAYEITHDRFIVSALEQVNLMNVQ